MSLDFIRKKMINYVPVCNTQLTLSLMWIFSICIKDDEDFIAECISDKVKAEDIIKKLNMYFLFSLIWSHGAISDEKGMKAYSGFIRQTFADPHPIPNKKGKTIKFDSSCLMKEMGQTIVHNFLIHARSGKLWKEEVE